LSRGRRPPAWSRPREAVRATVSGTRAAWQSLAGRGFEFAHQPLGAHVDPAAIRGYYLDFRHKARVAAGQPNGFPVLPRDGRPADWAVPVAQTALGYWDLHLDGEPTAERFLTLADWLVERARREDQGAVWRAPLRVPKYGLEPGWASALGQSQAISTLLRAHALTRSSSYLEVAAAALGPLLRPVGDGGLARRLDGHLVLEEYPTVRPCAVLNGWVAALLGVHELRLAGGAPEAAALFNESSDGLLALLPRYDIGWWTLYSLHPHGRRDLAKPNYQRLHPVVLEALALVRPDERLHALARRWGDQYRPLNVARASLDKLVFRAHRATSGR
jgi:hypothetical protein